MRAIILLLLISLAFTGSVTQTYYQTVSESGSSVISQELDATVIMQFMPDGTINSMQSACLLDEELSCSINVNDNIIRTSREFEADGYYYSFEAEYEIPYVDYTLTVNKVPKDVFSKAIEKIIVEAGIPVEGGSNLVPIDLTDKESGRTLSSQMDNFNLDILYIMEMPGGITSAQAGELNGEIAGEAATFNLREVLADSAPIVVKSRQINWLYLIAIAGIVIVIVMAASFMRKKRRMPAPQVKDTRIARPRPAIKKKVVKRRKKTK